MALVYAFLVRIVAARPVLEAVRLVCAVLCWEKGMISNTVRLKKKENGILLSWGSAREINTAQAGGKQEYPWFVETG